MKKIPTVFQARLPSEAMTGWHLYDDIVGIFGTIWFVLILAFCLFVAVFYLLERHRSHSEHPAVVAERMRQRERERLGVELKQGTCVQITRVEVSASPWDTTPGPGEISGEGYARAPYDWDESA